MAQHLAGIDSTPVGETVSAGIGGTRSGFRRPEQVFPRYKGTVHAVDPQREPYALCGMVDEPLSPFDPPRMFEQFRPGGAGQPYDKCGGCTDLTED